MKNSIPKVIFTLPSITQESRTLMWFCSPRPVGWDWSHVIYNRHPELKDMLQGITDRNEIQSICYVYAKKFRKDNLKDFQNALDESNKFWEPIEKEFLQTLSEHFEIVYPPKHKIIRAFVSMVPIYPRSILGWNYNTSYFAPEKAREIACHEIVHFLYFAKWLEIFPNTPIKQLDSPYLAWRLSEILDPVILNNHPIFKTYFERKLNTYKEFQKLRIEGKQPTTFFSNIYKKHLKSKAPFEEFLKTCWTEARKHKKILMNV